jgi:hypothetical protein
MTTGNGRMGRELRMSLSEVDADLAEVQHDRYYWH